MKIEEKQETTIKLVGENGWRAEGTLSGSRWHVWRNADGYVSNSASGDKQVLSEMREMLNAILDS